MHELLLYFLILTGIGMFALVAIFWLDCKRAKHQVELIERLMKDPKFKDAWCENAVRETLERK